MANIYVSYKCKTCGKELTLLIVDVEKHKNRNKYLVCPYCSSKRLEKEKVSDVVRECMGARSYRRIKRAIREVK